MAESDAPDWLVEIVTNTSRLMSSTPKSVADAVWWEFRKRIALEVKEGLDMRADQLDRLIATLTADMRLVDRETGAVL